MLHLFPSSDYQDNLIQKGVVKNKERGAWNEYFKR